MLSINKQLININYSQGRSITPEYIVIHETDNEDSGADAMANRNYFANHEEAQASTHFVVDDHQIVQCAELDWRCWHVGDNRGYSDITNSNSIGIEICVNSDGNYNQALENAIELTRYLMSELGLGIDRVVRHYDASGKHCPRRILDNGIWEEVKSKINGSPVSVPVVNGGGSSNLIDRSREFVGNRCSELQQLLISKGYNCGGYGADGCFGQGTLDSLLQFQKDNGLVPDGLAGDSTFAKLYENSQLQGDDWVRRLQQECNNQEFSNQVVDGIAGDNTLNGCPTLQQGVSGNITRLLQEKLNNLGYDTNGIDGDFGNGTYNAVFNFQRDHNLSADGIVGKLTWHELLGM